MTIPICPSCRVVLPSSCICPRCGTINIFALQYEQKRALLLEKIIADAPDFGKEDVPELSKKEAKVVRLPTHDSSA